MPGDNGFFPPVQYSALWTILGVGLLLLVVAWFVALHFITRPKPVRREPVPMSALPVAGPSLRETYLGLIDDVERAHAAGAIEFRQAHQQLSLIVREFAATARGVRAQYMTLEELRSTQLEPLAQTIGELYPGAFSGSERGTVSQSADRARLLVGQWR